MKVCFSRCVAEHIKERKNTKGSLHIEFGSANWILQNLRILQILIQSEMERDLFEVFTVILCVNTDDNLANVSSIKGIRKRYRNTFGKELRYAEDLL